MAQPLYDFGGRGPVIHLAVANGFPPASYTPLLQPLTDHYQVVSLPPRALWPDSNRLEKPDSWRAMGDDLVAGLAAYDLSNVIAMGHSMGAIASLMAVVQAPERFRALCLLEPTILPDHGLALIVQAQQKGRAGDIPLALGARRRRDHFAGEQEAFAYWRSRRLFRDWSDDALLAYTRSMLQPTANGAGYTLTWPPEWEAHYYETIETRPWEIVAQLPAQLPVLVIAGETTDTFVPAAADRLREVLPGATFRTVPGYGHLFPQAAPDAARAIIQEWLVTLA